MKCRDHDEARLREQIALFRYGLIADRKRSVIPSSVYAASR
jgi:hypothetical protein